MKHRVLILSDEVGKGKTTALQNWVKTRNNIGGFLSPNINGKRMFMNIETADLIPMETENKDLEVGRFAFDKENFQKVANEIKTLWTREDVKTLIIDEVGPLEIRKNLGFHELLLFLQNNIKPGSPDLLLVVRDYCLNEFLEKYEFGNVEVFDLEEFERNKF